MVPGAAGLAAGLAGATGAAEKVDLRPVVARVEVEMPEGTMVWAERREGQSAWEAAGVFLEGLGEMSGAYSGDRARLAGLLGAEDWEAVVASVVVELPDGTRVWAERREGQSAWEATEAFIKGLGERSPEMAGYRARLAGLLGLEGWEDVVASVEVELPDGTKAWAEWREGQTSWEAAGAFLNGSDGANDHLVSELARRFRQNDERVVVSRAWLPMPDGSTVEVPVRAREPASEAVDRLLEQLGSDGGALDREAVIDWLLGALERTVDFDTREDLGHVAEREGLTVGAELGVHRGEFARELLSKWPSVENFALVDVWKRLDNYKDNCNVPNIGQEKAYETAMENTREFRDMGVEMPVCRDFTSACVERFADATFDFIYLDAAHDFKSVYRDLSDWWPKLRPGGIFAGHDYVTQDEGPEQSGMDWTVQYDGSIDETRTAVKGAVNLFAQERGLVVSLGRFERSFPSWAMRKPEDDVGSGVSGLSQGSTKSRDAPDYGTTVSARASN